MSSQISSQPILVFDIDGVVRDVGGSYRRALADTVEQFTQGGFRPTAQQIDELKEEGLWNNDWEGSRELVYRYFEQQGVARESLALDYKQLVSFFQSRYRGSDPQNPDSWTGYITTEPLLLDTAYFEALSAAGLSWGFFSGATRGSALYVLARRLGLVDPVLVAMEDAPGKPDPTGLLATVRLLDAGYPQRPVFYIGDTVADMQTVVKARSVEPNRPWLGVGVPPPHVLRGAATDPAGFQHYIQSLQASGANVILQCAAELTPARVAELCATLGSNHPDSLTPTQGILG
ncbi:TIGR01548 family HAD-type hydrolase [Leptolyngbya sp. FACHB-261]|nr:TIGR01548 family HAD-type hydrolase [Leptolyngbya sp. FACHB-261]